jgi:transcriptional regulator GlxA family with amidase domain
MIDSLARILFVEVLRLCVAHENSQKGWLGALVDAKIGAALAVMHRDVTKRLTVDHIATAVGMSRSSFALRFKVLVGQSPLDYRLQLNMRRAAQLLRSNSRTVSSVAYELGYEFEKSFGKAFKRVMGCPPTSYRQTDTELCQR